MEGEVITTTETNTETNEVKLETQIVSALDLLSGDINTNPVVANQSTQTNDDGDVTNTTTTTSDADITASNTQTTQTEDTTTQTATSEEYDEAKVLDFFKNKKGKEIANLDDLLKEPEVKTVNPYEKISDKTKAFLEFNLETGRDYEDYLALQKDISAIPDIELAREKVRLENGSQWSDDEIDSYLERKLSIDLSDLSEMDAADKIALSGFSKSLRESKLSEQEKYKQPLENNQVASEQNQIAEDEVELETGQRIKKADYDKMLKDRQDYLDGLKAASDNIKEASFAIKVDNKGSEQTLNLSYEYSEQDKHNMLSYAEDLQKTIKENYLTDKGFKTQELQEDAFWMNRTNRERAISAIVHKAIAGNTERLMKEINNVNLNPSSHQSLTPHAKEGTKIVSAKELLT